MTQDEYAEMLSQAKEQFKQGTPLFGKDGAFHRGRFPQFSSRG